MHFEHTEDRRLLVATLDRFVAERWRFDDWLRVAHGPEGFSADRWAMLASLGAIAALFPESDGGLGGEGADVMVVFESLGRSLIVEPLLGALVVGRAIAHAGDARQRALVPTLIEGTIAALAHEEPQTHHESTRVACRAQRVAGGWQLDGAKTAVLQGHRASWLLVSARTAGAVDEAAGVSLFLVPGDAPGLTWREQGLVDGGRAADLRLTAVHLSETALLGAEGGGAAILEHALGWGLLALCAEALGAMDIARRDTLDYVRTRRQFGVPIGSFQALQHRMADVLLEIEQARSAVVNAAAAIDGDRTDRERALSAAKVTIGRVGTLVAEECIQMHGGIGMTWELPMAHFAKRLVMIDHQFGDEDHHLARYMQLAGLGPQAGGAAQPGRPQA